MSMVPVPLEIICYHCQQSAEKALKAYLAYKEQEVPRTHDLTFLLDKCLQFDSSLRVLDDAAFSLSDYSVIVRYPFSIDLTTDDARKAIGDARRFREEIADKTELG